MPKGTVKWFNAKRGFGFIVSPDVAVDVFVHHEDIQAEGFRTLEPDEVVMFDMVPDAVRGARAKNIVPLRGVGERGFHDGELGGSKKSMESNPPGGKQQSEVALHVGFNVSNDVYFDAETPVSRGKKKRSKQQRRPWKEDVGF